MRTGIKIGSSLLVNGGGEVNEATIIEICRQIHELLKDGHEVFLVSSGAVHSCPVKSISKNLRASAGQVILISKYMRFFQIYKIIVAMILLTDYDLEHNKILKKTMMEAFKAGIVTVVNANDPVDNGELKELKLKENLKDCADNDRTFGRLCEIVEADLAIMGFDGEGFMVNGKKVDVVRAEKLDQLMHHAKGGSKFGHGSEGALTKVEVSKELVRNGIKVVWAPGREKDFILRAASLEKGFGTQFVL